MKKYSFEKTNIDTNNIVKERKSKYNFSSVDLETNFVTHKIDNKKKSLKRVENIKINE
ncbi:hypothetical protein [Clostridium intestinale]|uniref:hypothetical protein n=1 Tax=Clostridium intestinale TaxID=36845 RepID=UPI002DD64E17|nr:hypothetical protein [Clostridium intestinale]WRY53395.1 hypothetical protein P8F83_09340 [Clostridium intestinale]